MAEDRISWGAMLLLGIPPGVAMFVELCSTNALAFTMRKFAADPLLITFLGSIHWHVISSLPRLLHGEAIALGRLGGDGCRSFSADGRSWQSRSSRHAFAPNSWILSSRSSSSINSEWILVTRALEPALLRIGPPGQRGRAVVVKRVFMTHRQDLLFPGPHWAIRSRVWNEIAAGSLCASPLQISWRTTRLLYGRGPGCRLHTLGIAAFIRETKPPTEESGRTDSPQRSVPRLLTVDTRKLVPGPRLAARVHSRRSDNGPRTSPALADH